MLLTEWSDCRARYCRLILGRQGAPNNGNAILETCCRRLVETSKLAHTLRSLVGKIPEFLRVYAICGSNL